jgi:histidine triad (HIT) family protein
MGIFHKDKIPSEPIEECIFCQIVKGKVPCKRIAENKNAIAFLDVAPAADGHTLVIPKEHYQDLRSCPENVLNDVIALTKEVANILNNSILKP